MSTQGEGPAPLEHLLHEIRTPLSVVSGNVYIVHKHWDRLDESKRLSLLESALEHTEAISSALRSLRHIEAIRPRRGRLSSVSGAAGGDIGIEIHLDFGREIRIGRAPTSGGPGDQRSVVVLATLDALQGLVPFTVKLEDAAVVEVGTNRLAVVSLVRDSDTLVGSALVRGAEDDDALARATLDALNRFLRDPVLA